MGIHADDSVPPGELYCPTCEKYFADVAACPDDGSKLMRLDQVDPFLGRELDGRYTILERIGRGAMGMVYRAEQHSVDREVAIKVVGAGWASDADMIKRFLREAKLASKLSHPNAVSVLDFGQTADGVFYLVMELVSGRTLDEVITEERVFAPERVIRIGMQICDALERAHGLSIIHRDLKPANIMVMATGRDFVKVLDFGLAKSLAPDRTSATMTSEGALLGTPLFMPPEIATGQPCDGRADLYSLGCILYLLGTGTPVFDSQSIPELIAMHGTERAPRMQGVPAELADVVAKVLEKSPDDRYATATELREALESCLEPIRASLRSLATPPAMSAVRVPSAPAAAATSIPPPVRRRRWPFALAGVIAVAGVAAFAIARPGSDDPPTPPPVDDVVAPPAHAPSAPPARQPAPPITTEPAHPIATEPAPPIASEPPRTGKPSRRPARPRKASSAATATVTAPSPTPPPPDPTPEPKTVTPSQPAQGSGQLPF